MGSYNLTDTSAGSLTLGNGIGGSAGLAANYTLTGGSQTYTITQKVLNSSGSKDYDANTDVSHLPLRTSINGSNDANLFSTYLSCALNRHKSYQTSSTYFRTFIEKKE